MKTILSPGDFQSVIPTLPGVLNPGALADSILDMLGKPMPAQPEGDAGHRPPAGGEHKPSAAQPPAGSGPKPGGAQQPDTPSHDHRPAQTGGAGAQDRPKPQTGATPASAQAAAALAAAEDRVEAAQAAAAQAQAALDKAQREGDQAQAKIDLLQQQLNDAREQAQQAQAELEALQQQHAAATAKTDPAYLDRLFDNADRAGSAGHPDGLINVREAGSAGLAFVDNNNDGLMSRQELHAGQNDYLSAFKIADAMSGADNRVTAEDAKACGLKFQDANHDGVMDLAELFRVPVGTELLTTGAEGVVYLNTATGEARVPYEPAQS